MLNSFYPFIKTEIAHGTHFSQPSSFSLPQGRPSHFVPYLPIRNAHTVFNIPVTHPLTVSDWIPHRDPQPRDPLFCGVDRSLDPPRLAGIRHFLRDYTIEEGLHAMASLMAREGARCDNVYMPLLEYIQFEASLGSLVKYIANPATAGGNTGILCTSVVGPLYVYPDTGVSDIFFIQSDTWTNVVDKNGKHLTLSCSAPGYNGRLIINQDNKFFECRRCGIIEVDHNRFAPCNPESSQLATTA